MDLVPATSSWTPSPTLFLSLVFLHLLLLAEPLLQLLKVLALAIFSLQFDGIAKNIFVSDKGLRHSTILEDFYI
ncbi:hypothetical protein EJB05_06174 [Eragrostis curvula]|uniref:Uncharacterized protein n=1 Tax=Eragrostis curvula TaxID=38414 RepID=A0A5J9WFJ5_9POAL|nr:hypothetical protein EJB05_06174 [Eragrostis curvula]